MAPTFPCACLRIMRELEAKRGLKRGLAEDRRTAKARRVKGNMLALVPQSRNPERMPQRRLHLRLAQRWEQNGLGTLDQIGVGKLGVGNIQAAASNEHDVGNAMSS